MEYAFSSVDFDRPSFLFRFEDVLKGPLGGLFYKSFVGFMKLRGGERILDFGCGGGALTKVLLKYLDDIGSVTCLDTSGFWMERTRKRLSSYGNVTCLKGDIRHVKIPDRSFDVIAIVHVLHDIPPAERPSTVLSLGKKLTDTGRLFIHEPTRPSHGMSIKEIRSLMNSAGLKQVRAVLKNPAYMGQFENI
jgi:ubiquinone/menaquinone biosynthesis C-methylase UbiE